MFAFITISSDPSACNPSGTQLFMSNPNVIPTLKLHYKRIAIFPQWVLPYPVARHRSRSCYQIESPLLVALLIYHSLNFNHVLKHMGLILACVIFVLIQTKHICFSSEISLFSHNWNKPKLSRLRSFTGSISVTIRSFRGGYSNNTFAQTLRYQPLMGGLVYHAIIHTDTEDIFY